MPVVLDRLPLSIKEIEQALLNVLKNACEAIGKDGEVRASLASADGQPRFAIPDNGPAVSAEARAARDRRSAERHRADRA